MKTTTVQVAPNKWQVRVNGEWLRTAKTGTTRTFRTKREALRAAGTPV